MAKSQPEKYNPGELDRTRNNLGSLSREEAKRMAERLGGEVGIEKTDKALQEKYDRIKKESETRAMAAAGKYHPRNKKSDRKTAQKEKDDNAYSGHYKRKKLNTIAKISYFDRIKIDRIASRPEHRIKSRAAVISSYLSFLVKNRDLVNPEFIIDGDRYFYAHIEILVAKLRKLLKQVDPATYTDYINPFYREILDLLTSWDLRKMNMILAGLQKNPRNRDIRECAELCRLIYFPVFRLGNTDLKFVYGAVERLFKVIQLLKQDDPELLVELKNDYLDIRDKIKTVFKDVSYTCYPLLLKLTSSKFYYYRDLKTKNLKMIFRFLGIDNISVLIPPDDIEVLGKKQFSLKHLQKKIQKEKEEMLKRMSPESTDRDENEIQTTPELLEQLFPESNWKRFTDFPDFFPYFQPLFKFPKGTELIAPEDPLQQVMVLAAIIQELLYGFRSIKIHSESLETINKTLDDWHLFIDDMIQKNYTKLLVEYCRNIEKGTDLSTSKFAQKLLTDMYWLKRRFIFPFIKFRILYKSESVPLKAQKFHELVKRFFTALCSLMDEFDESPDRSRVIENYNSPFRLDIKNITSYRLKKILEAENLAATNENLLRYSLQLVSMLDFLLNSSNSPYYSTNAEELSVYRYDPVFHGKPLYSVTPVDTEAILKRY